MTILEINKPKNINANKKIIININKSQIQTYYYLLLFYLCKYFVKTKKNKNKIIIDTTFT